MHEFDTALHHNIVVNRKKRLMALDSLVDLYANDASDTAALRQHLRQYTYIDYAADDWLDKLLYTLPLRGMDEHGPTSINSENAAADDDTIQLR